MSRGLANIAGVGTQKFSEEIPKNLDYKLTANELDAVRNRLRELNLRMPQMFSISPLDPIRVFFLEVHLPKVAPFLPPL